MGEICSYLFKKHQIQHSRHRGNAAEIKCVLLLPISPKILNTEKPALNDHQNFQRNLGV